MNVRVSNWNEKHLNYEIETFLNLIFYVIKKMNWNEKHLNYEIETSEGLPGSKSIS